MTLRVGEPPDLQFNDKLSIYTKINTIHRICSIIFCPTDLRVQSCRSKRSRHLQYNSHVDVHNNHHNRYTDQYVLPPLTEDWLRVGSSHEGTTHQSAWLSSRRTEQCVGRDSEWLTSKARSSWQISRLLYWDASSQSGETRVASGRKEEVRCRALEV